MYFHRKIEKNLIDALAQFPACLITGARQVEKSTLLQKILPDYNYVTFDDPMIRKLAQDDPELFLATHKAPLIIDEIQYVPELLSYIKIAIDKKRHKYGQYIFTGSQIFQIMKGVSESLAGRIAIFHLYPFSFEEIKIDVFDDELVLNSYMKGFY